MSEKKDSEKAAGREKLTISPPNFQVAVFRLVGVSPLMMLRFGEKSLGKLREKMEAGTTAGSKKPKREPRDFNRDFREAMHVSSDGWIGVHAASIRNACIDVCRMVGYKMVHAKMSIFVEADGFDRVDGVPLIRLDAGEPEQSIMTVRNATGVVDLRCRPLWRQWALNPRIRFDADQFTVQDVANLVMRAGMQIGIGEGRPFSKESNGLGFGLFTIDNGEAKAS